MFIELYCMFFFGSDQLINNRAFLYGDSVFETLRIIDNKIVFWEDHYFRLMSSMRIIRLDIPDNYTPDFLKKNILKLHKTVSKNGHSRIRINVFRFSEGKYTPDNNKSSFMISCNEISSPEFKINNAKYNVINGHTGASYTPPNLGTFMGALEAYYRGMELTDEDNASQKPEGMG